ncbi:CBS domain -containing protein, putative [Babesia caballi]|uniref:CBS domain -containing protein, putative n=1 Tax=Babesia caballi TaxID=5871 RepID=A0AAV4LV77_BABCB|nr:CBS domain -containing protein, putative [Babesia caballi]
MADNVLSLAFVGRLGLANLRGDAKVEAVKAALRGVEAQLEDERRLNAAVSSHAGDDSAQQPSGGAAAPVAAVRVEPAAKSQTTAPEVEMMLHLLREKEMEAEEKTEAIASSRQHLNTQLITVARELIAQARDRTAWCSLVDAEPEEQGKVKWEGMPRLIALVVVAMALENIENVKSSVVVPALSNHVKHAFRYSFQSPKSDLCVVDHPEWAINYLRDAVRKYHVLFQLVKHEISSSTDELFNALIPEAETTALGDLGQKLRQGFHGLCAEFAQYSFVQKWALELAKEARAFVFSRLPLLVYEYRMTLSDTLLTMHQVTNITRTSGPQTKLSVSQTLFTDELRLNVMYNLLRAMTELATAVRAMDGAAAYEVFADMDRNTTIPCLALKYEADENEMVFELNHERKELCGALDALIALEKAAATGVVRKLFADDGIMEGIKCSSTTHDNWYLQDGGYLTHPVNTLVALLKMFDERCKCMETTKSRGEFATRVMVPVVNAYVEYIKSKWNAEDDVLRSCSLTAFLIDSTALLYDFLLRYPYSQYMAPVVSVVEKVTTKMVAIIGDYVDDLIQEPFSRVHDRRLEVMGTVSEKLMQLAVHCSAKSYKQILRRTVETVEQRLAAVLIPQRASQIILNHGAHLEMATHNCDVIYHELKVLTDGKYCPEDLQLIEVCVRGSVLTDAQDIKTLLSTNAEELVAALDAIKGCAAVEPVFRDASTGPCPPHRGARRSESNECRSSVTGSLLIESGSADFADAETAFDDILRLDDTSSDGSPRSQEDGEEPGDAALAGEALVIEKVKQRLKVGC